MRQRLGCANLGVERARSVPGIAGESRTEEPGGQEREVQDVECGVRGGY